VIDSEPPAPIAKIIEDEFSGLAFTQTDGNSHYVSKNPEDLASRNASIKEFLASDDLLEPTIHPTKHDIETIELTVQKYEAMLDVLMAQPNRSEEDEMLIDRLINKSGELFRYEELALAIGGAATEDTVDHRRVAGELSLEMLGGVHKEAFGKLLNELIDDAESLDSKYATELMTLVGRQPESESVKDSIELEESTREIVGEDLKTIFPGLRELLNEPDKGPVSPEQLIALFERMKDVADLEDDWTFELTDGTGAETSGSKRKVSVGRKHAPLSSKRSAVALGFHEVVVHGGRSEGITMPDSLDFEEGLATRLQQVISGEHRTPGVQYYLAIGLQAGVDRGGIPRNYRETFEIMWRREAILAEKAGNEVDEEVLRLKAQRQVHRTRRGGAVDTRDASYFVGAQKSAAWLNEIAQLPAAERRRKLSLALTHRFDPTVPEQLQYIERNS
jgi:hypothetical protein